MAETEARPVLEQLTQYTTDHPDDLFSVGLERPDYTTATPFVSYSGDITAHCAALRQLVGDAGWIIRCNPYSQAELRQLADSITAEIGPIGWGFDGSVLNVQLTTDQRATADDLLARYSPKVAIVLGAHPYPNLTDSTATCIDTDLANHRAATLRVELIDAPDLTSGRTVTTHIRISNDGTDAITFEQPRTAHLSDGARIVSTAAYQGPYAGTDLVSRPLTLQPAEATTVDLPVTTGTCDPAAGYQLPAGPYRLELALVHLCNNTEQCTPTDNWAGTVITVDD